MAALGDQADAEIAALVLDPVDLPPIDVPPVDVPPIDVPELEAHARDASDVPPPPNERPAGNFLEG